MASLEIIFYPLCTILIRNLKLAETSFISYNGVHCMIETKPQQAFSPLGRGLPQICTYHSEAQGSNPTYNIFSFSMCSQIVFDYFCCCIVKRKKINLKKSGLAHIEKKQCFSPPAVVRCLSLYNCAMNTLATGQQQPTGQRDNYVRTFLIAKVSIKDCFSYET